MTTVPEQFQSHRLAMRRFTEADKPWVFAYASDPEVTRYMDWPAHRNQADSAAFIQMTRDDWLTGRNYAWAITDRATTQPFGAVGCSGIAPRVSFGYVLSKDAWGRGYATEASFALHDWLARLDGVTRIWAVCDVDNAASAHVLEKLGLEREGILKNWKIRPNLPGKPARDSFLFSRPVGT